MQRSFRLLPCGCGSLTRPTRARGDWPMWGGTADRNMVSNMKGLPTSWDVKTKKNVKWVAPARLADLRQPGRRRRQVFVGTNNEGLRDPKAAGDRGVLMASANPTASSCGSTPTKNSPPAASTTGLTRASASSPLVEGDRLYYVTNRAS